MKDQKNQDTSTGTWPRRRLEEVADVITGVSSSRTGVRKDSVKLKTLHVRDIDEGTGRVTPLAEVKEEELPQALDQERASVRQGDLLVTCKGSLLKVGFVTEDSIGAIASSNLILVRPNPDQIQSPVLFAILRSPSVMDELKSRSRSSIQTIAISPRDIGSLSIPLPPLELQQKLAELIESTAEHSKAVLETVFQRSAITEAIVHCALWEGPGALKNYTREVTL